MFCTIRYPDNCLLRAFLLFLTCYKQMLEHYYPMRKTEILIYSLFQSLLENEKSHNTSETYQNPQLKKTLSFFDNQFLNKFPFICHITSTILITFFKSTSQVRSQIENSFETSFIEFSFHSFEYEFPTQHVLLKTSVEPLLYIYISFC